MLFVNVLTNTIPITKKQNIFLTESGLFYLLEDGVKRKILKITKIL